MIREPLDDHVHRDRHHEVHDEHEDHDHIVAVFADRTAAEAAVTALRDLGLGSEHLGVAVRSTDSIAFEHDEQADMVHDVQRSTAEGLPFGALAGLMLVTLAAPGFGVGGFLALGGAGALWGALLGGFVGVAKGSTGWGAHENLQDLPLQPGEVMVAVCSHHRAEEVITTLQHHQGRLLPGEHTSM
jgi:hypothetical protein